MEIYQEQTHARSEEEEDILRRSIKKARADGHKEDCSPVDVEMPIKDNPIAAMSFRKKLMRGTPASRVEEQDDWVSDDDEEDDGEGMDEECPDIRLTKEEKERIHWLWKRTLIIKLLGRNTGYHLLLKKIQEIWRPKASIDLVAIDNGFFLARFLSEEDYEYARDLG